MGRHSEVPEQTLKSLYFSSTIPTFSRNISKLRWWRTNRKNSTTRELKELNNERIERTQQQENRKNSTTRESKELDNERQKGGHDPCYMQKANGHLAGEARLI